MNREMLALTAPAPARTAPAPVPEPFRFRRHGTGAALPADLPLTLVVSRAAPPTDAAVAPVILSGLQPA